MFILGLLFSIVLAILNVYLPILAYVLYFSVAFILAILKTKNLMVAIKSVLAIIIQFFGYGYGFLKSTIILSLSSKKPEDLFSSLFFKP